MTDFTEDDRLRIAQAGLQQTAAAFPADVATGLANAASYRAVLAAQPEPALIGWPFGSGLTFATGTQEQPDDAD